ncbi:hypothetical protein OSTOST_19574, partial [Ostertagia ostertagi]
CCVDEVAAAHASCDAIVHYGLNQLTGRTSFIHIFYFRDFVLIKITESLPNAIAALIEHQCSVSRTLANQFSKLFHTIRIRNDTSRYLHFPFRTKQNLCLIQGCSFLAASLLISQHSTKRLREHVDNFILIERRCPVHLVDPSQRGHPNIENGGGSVVRSLGRLVSREFCDATAVQVCFVGDPASPLIPLWLLTYPQCTSLVCFDPQTSTVAKH